MKNLLVFVSVCIALSVFTLDLKAQKAGKYLIAYNVLADDKKDDYDVFVVGMDGKNRRNITNNPDVAWTYHAYKKKIFFISDRGACKRCYFLYEMNANGSYIRKVFDQRLADSWMGTRKKGREIVVTPRLKDEKQFYIVDVRSGKILRKIAPGFPQIGDPTFSPDGKQIVFRASREKRTKESKTFDELFIMDDVGKNIRQLTHYPKNDKTAKWHSYHAGPPRWNRKGGFITYQSKRDGKSSLYAVTPDGKRHWKLTENKLNEGWHDWSPDGKWLAVEMWKEVKDSAYEIYLMNYETKELRKLTNSTKYKYQQAPVFVESSRYETESSTNDNPRQDDLAELLRLQKQAETAHLTYDAQLLVSNFHEAGITEIKRGTVQTLSKEKGLERFENYFASVKFLEWADIKPPVITISDDGTLATIILQKRVRSVPKNDRDEKNLQHYEYAWMSVWRKFDGRWKMTSIISTDKKLK